MFRVVFIVLLLSLSVLSSDVAIVKNVAGEVFAKRADVMQNLLAGDKIKEGDVIVTKTKGVIGMIFDDGTVVSLGQNSIFSIDKYLFKPSENEFLFDVNMVKGLAAFESGKIGKLSPESVNFRVPEGVIGIRGTKFYVEVK